MNIHEYQAKELLRGYGVAVLQGFVAWTPEEAEAAAAKLPGPIFVVNISQRWVSTLISAVTHWMFTSSLGPVSALTDCKARPRSSTLQPRCRT